MVTWLTYALFIATTAIWLYVLLKFCVWAFT